MFASMLRRSWRQARAKAIKALQDHEEPLRITFEGRRYVCWLTLDGDGLVIQRIGRKPRGTAGC